MIIEMPNSIEQSDDSKISSHQIKQGAVLDASPTRFLHGENRKPN